MIPSEIQVTDTNDNPPIFDEPAYSFDIPENAERGYQVGIISAVDSDLGSNSMISYTVISDWANDVFSLNPQTGVFTLTARLDYEEVSEFLFAHFGAIGILTSIVRSGSTLYSGCASSRQWSSESVNYSHRLL